MRDPTYKAESWRILLNKHMITSTDIRIETATRNTQQVQAAAKRVSPRVEPDPELRKHVEKRLKELVKAYGDEKTSL